jgi:membrane associated rhomboid family serine protease
MFIPLGDDNSNRRSFPVIVPVMIFLNAVGWYLQLSRGDSFTYGYSFVPAEMTVGRDIIGPIRIAVDHQPVTFTLYRSPRPLLLTAFSAMFMHGSWGHLIGNMVYLWIFGDQIEDRLGRFRFLLFYIGCGLIATLAHYVVDTRSTLPCLGASGAIAGVLGAYLITHPQNRITVIVFRSLIHLPAVIVLGGWFLMQLVGQFGSAASSGSLVAYAAHIGGFVAGTLGILMLQRRSHFSDPRVVFRRRW